MKKYLRLSLGGFALVSLLTVVCSQSLDRRPSNKWIAAAEFLTEDLQSDVPRLNRFDRAVVLARMADAWWKIHPERSHSWFVKAVEFLELADSAEKSSACRLAAARSVLAVLATREKKLHDRLVSIIGAQEEQQSDAERMQNATALAEVGLALLDTDPESAERFGEASLRLGFSPRFANLLRRLHGRDQSLGERLYMVAIRAAEAGGDSNLFSGLLQASFRGPYNSETHKRLILTALAGTVRQSQAGQITSVPVCNLRFQLSSMLTQFDSLSRDQATRIRTALHFCTGAAESTRGDETRPDYTTASTVDELLDAAKAAKTVRDRDRYLLKAVHTAADKKDFERAIKILDSLDEENRERLKDSWESLRWSFASELACSRLSNGDQTGMNSVVQGTPANLRAFVNISLASTCKAASEEAQILELMTAARRELGKADKSSQADSYLSLVRLYARISPSEAPAVLAEAVSAINRSSERKNDECTDGQEVSRVLTTALLFKRFSLPASILAADDLGVRSAIGSVQAIDERAAMRLQLLAAALGQYESVQNRSKINDE